MFVTFVFSYSMSKRLIYISISLITAALLCVVSFQVAWYSNAHALKKQLLERSIQDALRDVVTMVETREAADIITDRIKFFAAPVSPMDEDIAQEYVAEVGIPPEPVIPVGPPAGWHHQPVFESRPAPAIAEKHEALLHLDSLKKHVKSLRLQKRSMQDFAMNILVMDSQRHALNAAAFTFNDSVSRVMISNLPPLLPGSFQSDLSRLRIDSLVSNGVRGMNFTMSGDSFMRVFNYQIPDIPAEKQQSKKRLPVKPAKKVLVKQRLNDVLNKLVKEMELKDKSPESRVPYDTLKTYISRALANHGILEEFLFEVSDSATQGATAMDTTRGETFCILLNPNDISGNAFALKLIIPGQEKRIFKSMTMHLAGSFVFTLIICCAFAYTIYVMIRQKKIADIRNDFINNMTHELKTPIATISLAADTISNSHTLTDSEKVRYYTSVIKEENSRMNSQVERVLQLALTDKNNFELSLAECYLNEMVLRALNTFRVIIEAEQRHIILDLEKEDVVLMADCFHLENAITNIIDNAIKYSGEKSTIKISTIWHAQTAELRIADEGIGMKKEVQKKVFDKFYREQQGNLHDIKGFGIGLSYVKNVIDAHKGKISLHSIPSKGTTFSITLQRKQG